MNDVSRFKRDAPRGRRLGRGPTVIEIASLAGLGTATVDRVLNGRGGVRESTRQQVFDVLKMLEGERRDLKAGPGPCQIAFLSESGTSFNDTLGQAVAAYAAGQTSVRCTFESSETSKTDPNAFAEVIARQGEVADGLVVVAREHPSINRAIRALQAGGIPVVCITTDLPGSHRATYVGNDQTSAGATAAYLMGRALGRRQGKVLLVISAPYRCQEDREIGFRRVLRSEFSGLIVDERIKSNDETEFSYRHMRDYIAEHGAPLGIYNVAAGNRGIANALRDARLLDHVVFIGHEMTSNTRILLESGAMDFAIGHDLDREVASSVEAIQRLRQTGTAESHHLTPVRVFTRFNCL